GATPAPSPAVEETAPPLPEADDEADGPSAKVYFVEFPPAAAAAAPAPADSGPEGEIVLTDSSASTVSRSEEEHSEWAPPAGMPTWWTRGGVQA
ncbi:MAG: hypothetical protein AB1679_35065, partial [Actinomycetota bacterium]